MVASMPSSLWAGETKAASNWESGQYSCSPGPLLPTNKAENIDKERYPDYSKREPRKAALFNYVIRVNILMKNLVFDLCGPPSWI